MLPHDSKKEKLKDIVIALHWAATTGNVGLVKYTLDQGVPIDSVITGFVPLQLACINDSNIAVVQYLIDRGANVNIQKWSKKHSVDKAQAVQGATGSTALHVACANGCIKIVDLLLRNNAMINVKDKYGTTPLDIAYTKNETEIIKLLKTAGQQLVTQDDQDKPKKSLDKPFVKTHKRSHSDKQPRTRRPSLPSIDENNNKPFLYNIHSTMNMTPAFQQQEARRSFSAHRPSFDDFYPITPRSSLDFKALARDIKSPRISEDSMISSQTSSIISTSGTDHTDWYGYGVVNLYDDDNYLVSLERRAYNLSSDENGQLERRSQEFRRIADNPNSNRRNVSTYNSDEDDDTSSESPPRHSESDLVQFQNSPTESKKNWITGLGKDAVENIARKSLDLRPSIETLTPSFVRRGNMQDDSSDDSERQQKPGFFSRWAPAWSRK